MKTQLITVPTFTYNQGDMFTDVNCERSISVDFYNGTIVIRQDGDYDQQEQIKICPDHLEKFIKELRRHKVEADKVLARKNS